MQIEKKKRKKDHFVISMTVMLRSNIKLIVVFSVTMDVKSNNTVQI